jgi:hypothetical protein
MAASPGGTAVALTSRMSSLLRIMTLAGVVSCVACGPDVSVVDDDGGGGDSGNVAGTEQGTCPSHLENGHGECPFDGALGPCVTWWWFENASCTPTAVDCEPANAGDTCPQVGDSCAVSPEGAGPSCYEEKYCDENHAWVTYWNGDDLICPSALPEAGQPCNPCNELAGSCAYLVESECGPQRAIAICRGEPYVWVVSQPRCPEPPEP